MRETQPDRDNPLVGSQTDDGEKLRDKAAGTGPDRGETGRDTPDQGQQSHTVSLEPGFLDDTVPAATPASNPPQRFANYELLEEVARGGMGVVYKARQDGLDRVVALKMILAGQFADEDAVRRFQGEARAAAALDHPDIVPVYEVGEFEGLQFYSMGFVEGESLAARIARGPLPPREAATIVRKAATAVDYAHRQGIIHRDLKPANVLIDAANQPRLTDFGLARSVQGDSGLTASGQILGTPSYMPPEQAAGRLSEVGPQSDVYSLGAMLYCLLAGRPPFQSASVVETLKQVVEREPVPLRQLNPATPRDLETVCLKCLEKVPGRRYATAEGLAAELGRWLDGAPILARRVGAVERAGKWCRRHPRMALLLAAFAASVVIGTAVSTIFAFAARASSREARRNAKTALLRADALEQALRRESDERQRAGRNENLAREAQHKAEENQRLADERAEDRRRALYLSWIALADARIDRLQPKQARQLLQQCPEDLRRWEWNHLWRMSDQSWLTLSGHENEVSSVAVSRDGTRIASAVGLYYTSRPPPGRIRIWDSRSGQLLRLISGNGKPVQDIDFHPDGVQLAAAGSDGSIRIWNVESGDELRSFDAHAGGVNVVRYDRAGTRLLSAGRDAAARLWTAGTGEPIREVGEHQKTVADADFSPDETNIVTADEAGQLKIWNIETGAQTGETKLDSGKMTALRYMPDGNLIACASMSPQYNVGLWHPVQKRMFRLSGHTSYPLALAPAPDGMLLASGAWDLTIRLWSLRTGQQQRLLIGHDDAVKALAWSPDGTRLVSGSKDGTVKVWDAVNDPEALQLYDKWVRAISIDGVSQRAAALCDDHTIRVWQLPACDLVLTRSVPFTSNAATLHLLPGGNRVIHIADSEARLINLVDGSLGQTGTIYPQDSRSPGPQRRQSAVNSNGTLLAVHDENGALSIWHTMNLTEPQLCVETPRETRSFRCAVLAFSGDGQRLLAVFTDMGRGQLLCEWEATSGRLLRQQAFSGPASHPAALSPDGSLLAGVINLAGRDPAIHVFDTHTGKRLHELRGHQYSVQSLTFMPDSARLVSGSWSRIIKLWDCQSGTEVLSLDRHHNQVDKLAVSPDGQVILSASHDGLLAWLGSPPSTGTQ